MDAMVDWANEATRECSDAPSHPSVEVYQHTKDNSPLRKTFLTSRIGVSLTHTLSLWRISSFRLTSSPSW
jgi:hypothetical protein